jgi:hypothetical protein
MAVQPKPGLLLEGYFTSDELAAELGVTTATLWSWSVRGVGPPRTRIGKTPYYAKASVVAWMKSREQTPSRDRASGSRKRSVA